MNQKEAQRIEWIIDHYQVNVLYDGHSRITIKAADETTTFAVIECYSNKNALLLYSHYTLKALIASQNHTDIAKITQESKIVKSQDAGLAAALDF